MAEREVKARRALARWCDAKLATEYGDRPRPRTRPDPLDELVLTLLSQNTNDRNRDRAYAELRRRWPRWEGVIAAAPGEVEDAIRSGGLARQKSLRLPAELKEIEAREGRLDLSRLCTLPLAEALKYLYSFKGVGEKTAAIVMLFACGRPVFPVDTHVFRVAGRVGLLPAGATVKAAHTLMQEVVREDAMYRFHLNLIEHGRKTCHPRKPECGRCCLRSRCPTSRAGKG
jgi:endonuclease-3